MVLLQRYCRANHDDKPVCTTWQPCSEWYNLVLWVQALTESLPVSPAAGVGPPPGPPAPARTPLTGKKRAREATEGVLPPPFCIPNKAFLHMLRHTALSRALSVGTAQHGSDND